MRQGSTLRPAFALALSCTILLGCPLLKKKQQDAAVEDEPPISNAPTVTVTGSGAKNEKDVLRYANETKLEDEAATIGKDGTLAKTFPGSGGEVATLSKGTAVVKIAKYFSTGVLIVFDDPTTADGTKLMGWVGPASLATPTAPPAATTVAPVHIVPKVVVDAGKRPVGPTDAGAAPVDAGKSVDPAKPVDAGRPVPSSGTITVRPDASGKCPAGMVLTAPLCRRLCNADSDCPKGAICQLTGFNKTCNVK